MPWGEKAGPTGNVCGPIDFTKFSHEVRGRCPLGDDCPCWEQGFKDGLRHECESTVHSARYLT